MESATHNAQRVVRCLGGEARVRAIALAVSQPLEIERPLLAQHLVLGQRVGRAIRPRGRVHRAHQAQRVELVDVVDARAADAELWRAQPHDRVGERAGADRVRHLASQVATSSSTGSKRRLECQLMLLLLLLDNASVELPDDACGLPRIGLEQAHEWICMSLHASFSLWWFVDTWIASVGMSSKTTICCCGHCSAATTTQQKQQKVLKIEANYRLYLYLEVVIFKILTTYNSERIADQARPIFCSI